MCKIIREIKKNVFVLIVRLGVHPNKEVYVYVVKMNLDLIILLKWFNMVIFHRFVKIVEISVKKTN